MKKCYLRHILPIDQLALGLRKPWSSKTRKPRPLGITWSNEVDETQKPYPEVVPRTRYPGMHTRKNPLRRPWIDNDNLLAHRYHEDPDFEQEVKRGDWD